MLQHISDAWGRSHEVITYVVARSRRRHDGFCKIQWRNVIAKGYSMQMQADACGFVGLFVIWTLAPLSVFARFNLTQAPCIGLYLLLLLNINFDHYINIEGRPKTNFDHYRNIEGRPTN